MNVLMRPKQLDSEIRKLKDRSEELKASLLPMGIRYDTDRVQTSPDDRVASVMAEIDSLERRIREKTIERSETIIRIGKLIDELEDQRIGEILNSYYIRGKSIKKIAREVYYSEKWVYRLKRIGEKKVAEESEKHIWYYGN